MSYIGECRRVLRLRSRFLRWWDEGPTPDAPEVRWSPSFLNPIMAGMMPFVSKPLHRPIRDSWGRLTLARQFAIAGSAVLIAGMVVIALWVTDQIAEGVTRNTAAATALYVDSV